MEVPASSRPRLIRSVGAALVVGAIVILAVSRTSGTAATQFGSEHLVAESGLVSDAGPDAGPSTPTGDASGPADTADEPAATPPPPSETPSSPFTTTAPRGAIDVTTWPATVRIATLGVTAPVEAVGVGSSGELIVPASPMDVGWYQGGAVPGEPGVALLTSHFDTRREGRGVFAGLVDLGPGASVVLEARDGTEQRWTVVARTQHKKDALPPELFSRAGTPVLALVTCGGPFDRERRSYRDNVIVWAELLP